MIIHEYNYTPYCPEGRAGGYGITIQFGYGEATSIGGNSFTVRRNYGISSGIGQGAYWTDKNDDAMGVLEGMEIKLN